MKSEPQSAGIIIIGAGVVGLAVAYELSRKFPKERTVLIEKNRRIGQEISSRNSEVIHAGIYYPADSLKTRLCVEGNRLLYGFCARFKIRHQKLGKIMVATDQEDLPLLQNLFDQGSAKGIDLRWLDKTEIKKMEPNIQCIAGILSPNTGIVEAHHLMQCLYQQAVEQGVIILLKCMVAGIEKVPGGYCVRAGGEDIKARVVINAAGLSSDKMAAAVGLNIDQYDYRLHYCKGEYYRLSSKIAVNHLIYPPPEHLGLGIHITKDLSGGLRLGPNAYYVEDLDYSQDETFRYQFYHAAKKYIPDLELSNIHPDYTGIRPKLQGPGETFRDFIICEEEDKGYPGFINLIGIESPGLTACLAIGRYTANLVE